MEEHGGLVERRVQRGTELGKGDSRKCRIAGKGVRSTLDLTEPRGSTQLGEATWKKRKKRPSRQWPAPRAAEGEHH